MLVERITAYVHIAQQVAVIAAANGGQPEWPTVEEKIAAFDELLATEPKSVPADSDLREALGLRV